MTKKTAIDKLVQQLATIDRDYAPKTGGELQRRLFQEHLRRMLLWGDKLGADYWYQFNIVKYIVPENKFPEEIQQKLLTIDGLSIRMLATFPYMVHWTLVADLPEVQAYQLPDPYAPLLLIYRQGAWFLTEQKYIELYLGHNLIESPQPSRRRFEGVAPFIDFDKSIFDVIEMDVKLGSTVIDE